MMKKEILDVRTLVTIVLIVLTLMGHKFSELSNKQSDAQNLKFITNPGIELLSLK